MIVLWMPEAIQDRLDIFAFVSADNVLAAVALDNAIDEAATKLATFPQMGRWGSFRARGN